MVEEAEEDEFCGDAEDLDLVEASSVDSVDKWEREERKREAAKPLFLVRYE